MFNAQKLLGSLMGDALSGALGSTRRKQKRRPSGLAGLLGGGSTSTKLKMGVGLLGLAYAAYEHYQQPAAGASASPPPAPSSASAIPPPPPASTPVNNEHALHLIRAMITAADSDGLIDAQERESIVTRAREAGLDAESLQALDVEISAPLSLKQLAARTPEILRDETYAAALIAISADTTQERAFLEQLAAALKLDAQAQLAIHQQLGL
jgi:uncharacterized membrane protein YebE (DUF533 family)